MKIPPRSTTGLLHFVKSPENLGRLVCGMEVAKVLNTEDLTFPINYLEKPINIWAKRKADPSIKDKLALNHTGTVRWYAEDQELLFDNCFSFKKPGNPENLSVGHRIYDVTMALKTPRLLVHSNAMASEQGYKLGRIIHGLTSQAYDEIARLFQQLVPYVFYPSNESTPFHLACQGIITKFQEQEELVDTIRKGSTLEAVTHPAFNNKVIQIITERFKTRASFKEVEFLALIPLSGLDYSKKSIDYCILLPPKAREKLEKEFQQALIPPPS